MHISKFLSISALFIGAAAAHAETYDGVHAVTSANSRRATVEAGVNLGHGGDPYAEAASGGVTVSMGKNDRASVRSGAVAAAHAMGANQEALAVHPQQIADGASPKHHAM